jgi:hypothetical protein
MNGFDTTNGKQGKQGKHRMLKNYLYSREMLWRQSLTHCGKGV